MRPPVVVLGLLLCGPVLGGPAALAADSAHASHEAEEHGSGADRALAEEARQVDEQVLVERARVTRLQARTRSEEYLARLEASPEKPGAQAARGRLLAAWTASADAVTRWWPVSPVRVCGNERLHFETALLDDDEDRREVTLREARTRLTACVKNARLVIGAMARTSSELEEALRAADAVLAATPGAESGPPSRPALPAER